MLEKDGVPVKVEDHFAAYKLILFSELSKVKPSFQRPVSMKQVNKIVDKWNKFMLNPPLVCEIVGRDGIQIIDGQHTVESTRLQGYNGMPMGHIGRVREKTAAALYILRNTLRRMVQGRDKFIASVIAGFEAEVSVADIIERYATYDKPGSREFDTIKCVAFLVAVWEKDPDILDDALFILCKAFNKDIPSNYCRWCNPLIIGLVNFLFAGKRSGKPIKRQEMVQILQDGGYTSTAVKNTAFELMYRTNNNPIAKGKNGYGEGECKVMYCFTDIYNEHVSDKKMLVDYTQVTIKM